MVSYDEKMKCPKCGNTTSFAVTLIITEYWDWDEEAGEYDAEESGQGYRTIRCGECDHLLEENVPVC